MLTEKEKMLLNALEPQAEEHGIEIVTVEVVGARKSPTIRVFIDTPNGVGFDELSSAQSWIDGIIEAIDPFPGAYMLEVSSPGIDRPLRTPKHFIDRIGQEAQVRTASKIDGRASFSGTIAEADESGIVIDCDGDQYKIPYEAIKRANLKGVVEFR